MNLRHLYERSQHVTLWDSRRQDSALLSDLSQCKDVVQELKRIAAKDMAAEGFSAENIQYSLELDMRYGGQHTLTRVFAPTVDFDGAGAAQQVLEAFEKRYEQLYSSLTADRNIGVEIESFYLTAEIVMPGPNLTRVATVEGDGKAARSGQRDVYWLAAKGILPTPIFDASLLRPGEKIEGPAIVEATDTTIAISPGWVYRLDEFLNVRLTNKEVK
jgi:N-methylhydantoinase A/acetophenone carboxylase